MPRKTNTAAMIMLIVLITYCQSATDINKSAYSPLPLGLVSSGAVSLGSYQAGYHYYSVEWLKLNREKFDVKIVTGASAGAINALFTVLSLADTIHSVDTASLFYKAWIPVGIEHFKGCSDPRGFFNRSRMNSIADTVIDSMFHKVQEKALNSNKLDLVMAIAVNRNEPIFEKLGEFNIPRSKDAFVIKVDKKEYKPIEFSNYYYQDLNLLWNFLPLKKSGTTTNQDNKNILKSLIYSSSAFPLAFPPYDNLSVMTINPNQCLTRLSESELQQKDIWEYALNECNASVSHPSFSDGGLYNNEPIRLAYKLVSDGLNKMDNHYRWNQILSRSNDEAVNKHLLFAYLNPDNKVYPKYKVLKQHKPGNIIDIIKYDFPQVFEASRKNELYTLLEENDFIEKQLIATQNYLGQMSGYFGSFFGFFDIGFRKYDFYVGMYDAVRLFRKFREPNGGFLNPVYPQLCFNESIPSDKPDNTLFIRKEFCLLNNVMDYIYNEVDSLSDNKHSIDPLPIDSLHKWTKNCDHNFIVLLQSSIDRLWANWQLAIKDTNMNRSETYGGYLNKWVFLDSVSIPPQILTSIPDDVFNKRYKRTKAMIREGNEIDAVIEMLNDYGYLFEKHNRSGMKSEIKKDIDNLTTNLSNNTQQSNTQYSGLIGFTDHRLLKAYLYEPEPLDLNLFYSTNSGITGWGVNLRWALSSGFTQPKLKFGLRLKNAYINSKDWEVDGCAGIDINVVDKLNSLRHVKYAWMHSAIKILFISDPIIQKTFSAHILLNPSFANYHYKNDDVSLSKYALCLGYTIGIFNFLTLGIEEQFISEKNEYSSHLSFQAGIQATGNDFVNIWHIISGGEKGK
jgi:predicted acylesterase/phospholipase RssA